MTSAYLLHLFIVYSIVAGGGAAWWIGAEGARIVPLAGGALLGVGAYVTALVFSPHAALLGRAAVPVAVVGAACVGALVALTLLPLVRALRGDLLVLGLVAAQLVADSFYAGARPVTGGAAGVSGPFLSGAALSSGDGLAVLSGAYLLTCTATALVLRRSRFWVNLLSVRDDEILAASAGRAVFRYRAVVFVLGNALAAAGGSLFALYLGHVGPASFNLWASVMVAVVVLVPFPRQAWSPLLGAGAVVLLPELVSRLDVPVVETGNIRRLVFGLLLVGIALSGRISAARFSRHSGDA